VGITAELLPNPPGVTARFTVSWTSSAPGQGQIRFGTTCNGLVETGTRDQHAGTTQHAVIVTGNDLPSSAGDVGIAPGTTYFFEIVTITKSGEVVDNNSGKCYSVTIPNVNSVGTTRVLTATLSGANEVPAGAPGSSGTSTVTINTSTNTVCYSITVSGITLPAIAAHIHRGAARVNGPVVIPFNPPGVNGITNGCTTADPALLQDIVANPANYYVNVHTTEFPGGALRGQLGTARVLTAQLSANNEIPAGPPGGAGAATVTVNTSNNTVCYTLSVTGIRLPAIAAHIHRGAASVNGPVVVPFNAPGANGTSTGCTAADPALLQDIVTNPANYYVNVHTTDFPGGAIRGQLG